MRSPRPTALLPILLASASMAQPPRMQPDSRRDCAICHLQWVDAFAQRGAVVLVEPPGDLAVSQPATCLGCHDGSVIDSRRPVWLEHSHRTGIRPPESMQVPAQLPLEDGKITCRTCHSAHSTGGPETVATAVFLRVPNEASQLCQMCHPEKAKGPELGTHPVGGMPWPVPDQLVAAGARAPGGYRLICQTCHTPHGSRQEHLLVMGTESSQLCLTCHEKLRPALWRPDLQRPHPQNPPLTSDAQRQAIRDLGTRTGPGETLICLSCHKLHHGLAGRDMLADTLEGSRLCIRCHPERANIFTSGHDLRRTAPQERNRRGLTPEQSGPCGACHSFHQFARRPEPGPADPTGLCFTCHQPGQCAEEASGQPFSHPLAMGGAVLPERSSLTLYTAAEDRSVKTLACLTCHDPHDTQHPHFLRLQADAICAQCHAAASQTLAGSHDLVNHPTARNARGETAAQTGRCGFCHAVHNASGPAMWVATQASPGAPDELCTECHRPQGLADAKPATKFHHPTGPRKTNFEVAHDPNLPLFTVQGRRSEDGFVACASCHDPHADSGKRPGMLRVPGPASRLCSACHPCEASLARGVHDATVAPQTWPEPCRTKLDLCLSCHLPHGNDPAQQLWTVAPRPTLAPPDGVCLACHPQMQWTGHGMQLQPGTTLHPRELTARVRARELPLVPSAEGHTPDIIGCKTCHDPHGRPTGPVHILRAGPTSDPASMCVRCHQDQQYIGMSLHSERALSQPGETRQICGPCHRVHAKAGTSAAKMWDGPTGPADEPPDVRRCTGCHGSRGRATRITIVNHPAAALQNVEPSGSAGFMPLVDERGTISDRGRITCITCHVAHGQPLGNGFAAIDPHRTTPKQLKTMMPMLRPYVAPNLCSSCHGFDGLRRYLYFHRPDKRRGTRALSSFSAVDIDGNPLRLWPVAPERARQASLCCRLLARSAAP